MQRRMPGERSSTTAISQTFRWLRHRWTCGCSIGFQLGSMRRHRTIGVENGIGSTLERMGASSSSRGTRAMCVPHRSARMVHGSSRDQLTTPQEYGTRRRESPSPSSRGTLTGCFPHRLARMARGSSPRRWTKPHGCGTPSPTASATPSAKPTPAARTATPSSKRGWPSPALAPRPRLRLSLRTDQHSSGIVAYEPTAEPGRMQVCAAGGACLRRFMGVHISS